MIQILLQYYYNYYIIISTIIQCVLWYSCSTMRRMYLLQKKHESPRIYFSYQPKAFDRKHQKFWFKNELYFHASTARPLFCLFVCTQNSSLRMVKSVHTSPKSSMLILTGSIAFLKPINFEGGDKEAFQLLKNSS